MLYKDEIIYLFMDCSQIVKDVIAHFQEGYRIHWQDFFGRSCDVLRKELRENYFDDFRKGKNYYSDDSHPRPKTTDFISVVKLEILLDLAQGKKIDFNANNGTIHDPNNLIGRSLESLRRIGYGYLVDGINGK